MSTSPQRGSPVRRLIERRLDGPRRVRHGLKLRGLVDFALVSPDSSAPDQAPSPKAQAPNAVLAARWIELLRSWIEPSRFQTGVEYARAGQTVSLDIQPGALEAQVQGTAARPYATSIRIEQFTPAQWDKIIELMAAEAVYVAKLLGNELPATVDDLLATVGLSLLPSGRGEAEREEHPPIQFACACSDDQPCKHAAAAGLLLAERLIDSPLLLLTLRGMHAERMLERLRRARTIQTHGVASAHADPMIPESQVEPPPLEACIDEFWRTGPELADLEHRPPPQHVPHALLRRLGPSPLQGKFPMAGLLASVYDTVAAAAKRLRDPSEPPS